MYKGMDSGYESNITSGIKFQFVFDYLNQTLDQLNITEEVRSLDTKNILTDMLLFSLIPPKVY
jgi:hypothetical protein